MAETYFIQSKNGTSSGWKTESKTTSMKVAQSRCLQAMKQTRGKVGFEYFKTRVVVEIDGKPTQVFP